MSDSYKKINIGPVCYCKSGAMKLFKKRCNKKLRQIEGFVDGSNYKRLAHDLWTAPSDGKCLHNEDRFKRK